MSEYSRELHSKLLEYRTLETRLNDPRVDRLHVHAISKNDLSSVRIDKTGELEPLDIGLEIPPMMVCKALITITETRNNPKINEDALVKQTEYMVNADGGFSEPLQRYRIYPASQTENIYVADEIARLIGDLTKKLISQENMDANPEEIANTKFHISNANKELKVLLEEDRRFNASAFEYDNDEHERLLKKLGSLVLY